MVDPFSKSIQAQMFKYHGTSKASDEITIVDIDTRSLHELGQWPFPRDYMGKVLENLTAAGAGIIGIDVVFSSPDRLSPKTFAARLNLEGDFFDSDAYLAEVLSRTPTILGYFFDFEKNNYQSAPFLPIEIIADKPLDSLDSIPEAIGVDRSIDIISSAAYSSGFFNVLEHTAIYISKMPLIIKFDKGYYTSLAFEMLRIAYGSSSVHLHYDDVLKGVELGDLSIPTDAFSRINLNYRGEGFTYKYLSFVDVYNNDFNSSDIEGKFILIGTSDYGLNDRVNTLYDSQMPGVEVHATVIDNILNQDFLYTPENAHVIVILVIFAFTLLFGFFFYRVSLLFSFLSALIFLSILVYMTYFSMFEYGIIFDIFYPIISLFFTLLFLSLSKFYDENQQKSLIRDKFSKKVSSAVVDDILKNSALNFEGVDRELTIFFSDIRGFTPLSEKLNDSKKLIKLLNRYMEPMIDDIIEHKGTVDKLIGDAVMAYWNAPTRCENHAEFAVSSALSQLEKLVELNIELKKEFDVTIKIGIGIHTGDCVVGEMGSHDRSDYTIIGDNVNLASRIEGLCKNYDQTLLISKSTKDLLGDEYLATKIDSVVVKGKSEAVDIYSVKRR